MRSIPTVRQFGGCLVGVFHNEKMNKNPLGQCTETTIKQTHTNTTNNAIQHTRTRVRSVGARARAMTQCTPGKRDPSSSHKLRATHSLRNISSGFEPGGLEVRWRRCCGCSCSCCGGAKCCARLSGQQGGFDIIGNRGNPPPQAVVKARRSRAAVVTLFLLRGSAVANMLSLTVCFWIRCVCLFCFLIFVCV